MIKNKPASLFPGLLVSGFLILIAMMLLVEIMSIQTVDSIAESNKNIYKYSFAVSSAALEAKSDIISIHRYMKDVTLARNSEELEFAISLVDKEEAEAFEHFDLIMERFLGNKTRIERARQLFTDWKPIRAEIIELARLGRNDKAALITKGKGARYVARLTGEMDSLVESAHHEANKFISQSIEQQDKSKKLLYGMMAMILIIGLFISYFVTKKIEKGSNELRESEKKYRGLLETAPDGMVVVNAKGEIEIVNQRLQQMTGYTADDLTSKPVETLIPERFERHQQQRDGYIANPHNRMMGEGMELFVRRKDGSEFPAEISLSPLKTADGPNVSAAIRDITERKRLGEEKYKLEMHLRQQQKLESIGTLAGGIAHEINNPITGIINYAQLIRERLDPDSPLHEFADEIGRETERVATIVRNLLTFARQEKEAHSPARLADIVNNTLSLIGTIIRRDQIMLEVDVPDDLPKIKCRSQQIQQVLMNLFTNARDALNARYPEYDLDKVMKLTVRSLEIEGEIWLRTTVEDHGVGIPDEIRDNIFDPFFTTKDRAKGTGLGLSISHGIIQDHNGKLSFECEAGRYTRFYIDLPLNGNWSLEEASGGIANG